jgi:RNA polymerase sigma-70 factor (ECF subfamily)
VFIKAMRGLPSYRYRGLPFVAWLLQIARNELADHYKRRKREAHAPLHDQSLGGLVAQDDPEHTALRLAEVQNVRQAMEQLTELQQEVLRLRFDGQLSVAETAHAMKRKEGAVKVLQHSALRALRRAMGADAA